MHILAVEDDKKISSHIKRSLEDAQFTVTCVFDGATALQKTESYTYDAIILDLMLPDMNGIEICEQIRQTNKTVPVLMLTSQSDIDNKVSGLNAGADDYLCKPFSFEELIARLRALMRRGGEVAETELTITGVTINPIKYTVHVNNDFISLTSREYKMLEYMMRHANQVCTKLMVEEHVWGTRYEQESNIIEVTLSRLRKKIENAGVPNFIKTRHGLGYVIDDLTK